MTPELHFQNFAPAVAVLRLTCARDQRAPHRLYKFAGFTLRGAHMDHRSRLLVFSILPILLVSTTVQAQAPAPAAPSYRYQLFGGYSFLSNSFNGHASATSQQPLNGWNVALTVPAWRALGIRVDTAGYYGTSLGSPQRPIFVLGGIQYSKHFGREIPFVEGLVGIGHLNSDWWGGNTPGHTASFTSVAGGGVDTLITPRIAFRVEGGFQYTNFTIPDDQIHSLPNYFARIATGVVWRF